MGLGGILVGTLDLWLEIAGSVPATALSSAILGKLFNTFSSVRDYRAVGTSSRHRPFCFHDFVFLLNCLFVLYNAHRISVCVIAVSKSHEFLLKVRQLSSFFSTTTPTPSRRRVVIFSTTTQAIRLRRVDVFSTTSDTSPPYGPNSLGGFALLFYAPQCRKASSIKYGCKSCFTFSFQLFWQLIEYGTTLPLLLLLHCNLEFVSATVSLWLHLKWGYGGGSFLWFVRL